MRDKRRISLAGSLVSANHLDRSGFSRFIFSPGMLFGSGEKWWNSPGKRPVPHEGVDICFYCTTAGDIQSLGSMTKVACPFHARD